MILMIHRRNHHKLINQLINQSFNERVCVFGFLTVINLVQTLYNYNLYFIAEL